MGPARGKGEQLLTVEVEAILALLLKLFHDFPIERVHEIPAGEVYNILYNVLRPSSADKYRLQGFSLLVCYLGLKTSAKEQIEEVMDTQNRLEIPELV